MTSLKASTSTSFDSFENIFDSEFGFGYGAIVDGVGYISVQSRPSSYDYDHLEDDYYVNYEGDVWSECIDDVEVQCDLIQYEIAMFFESVSTNSTNYADDFWFAGCCLREEFMPHPPFNVGGYDYPAY